MATDTRIGSELLGYRLEGVLGRGGMGVVYRAHDPELNRQVALKLVAPELAGDPEFRERFRREMEIAAALEHPHVCPVYRAGEDAGELVVCMRLLEGEDLGARIERAGPLPPEDAFRLLSQLASALDYAHARSLLHRDVKPGNVLLDEAGNAYLCDFGLAAERFSAEDGAGTLAYMAPERLQGGEALPASDLYALACLAYLLLTGDPPFRAEHEAGLLYAHLRSDPPSLAVRGLARFDAVLRQALAKDPDERFASCADFLVALAEAERAGDPHAPTLPRAATSFLGRERELRELGKLLASGEARLLTLTGPGGIGKTRLALEAASRAAGRFPEGVHWISLAALRDPELVLSSVAHALGTTGEPAAEIGERKLLLVLDNFEQVVEAAPALSELLSACPRLQLLVTSRETLRLQAETEYPVPALEPGEAVRLFCQRARVDESETVQTLCERLEGLPLAIELAAARSTLFSPEQLLERLSQRLDLFKGPRDVDPRQQTLRATIAWSYELLQETEQRLFARLSVFAGGAFYEAAEEVAGADPDTLQSLLEKSLLRRRDTPFGPRYWMLETIRAYAVERLSESGEEGEVGERHAQWVLALVTLPKRELVGPARSWLELLELELENLRAALAWCEEAEQVGTWLELIGRSWGFWDTRGRWHEARRSAEAALAASAGERSERRAKVLRAAGSHARALGDHDAAKANGEEAAALSRELGASSELMSALQDLAANEADRGAYDEAERLYAEAFELAQAAGDQRNLAFLAGNRGDLALNLGDHTRALALTKEALASFRELADEEGIGWMMSNLAICLLLSRRDDEALLAVRESFAVSGALHDRAVLAWGVAALLGILCRRNDVELGARLCGVLGRELEQTAYVLTGVEADIASSTEAELRELLGEERFQVAYDEWAELSTEEAVERALALTAPE